MTLVSCKKGEANYNEKSSASEVLDIELPESAATDKASSPEVTEQKIIKNGKLRFETADLDKTANQIF